MTQEPRINIAEKLKKYIPGKLSKPVKTFVTSTVEALIKSGSLLLTEISRSLNRNEVRSGKKLETNIKWLERNLENDKWQSIEIYKHYWKELKLKPKTVISIDIGDIRKNYAKKMEALADIRDGSTGEICTGYWTLEIQAIQEKGKQIPLLLEPYSQEEKGFKSQNKVIESWLNNLFDTIGNVGIAVSDRGFVIPEYIKILSKRAKNFVQRLKSDTPLSRYGKSKPVSKWSEEVNMNYEYKFKNSEGKEQIIKMGFLPVKYSNIDKQLYFIVVNTSWLKNPMYLLTDINPRIKGNLARIRRIYLMRWGVEDAGRFYKQSFNLEKVRVMSLEAIRKLCLMCVLSFFILESIRAKGGKLLEKIIRLGKSLKKKDVKFLYYQIIRGVRVMLDSS